jgi:hypothetical protein
MSKADIPASIDFKGAERGRYAARYASGTNVVVLDPDVAARFATAAQVNDVLRSVIEVSSQLTMPKRSAMALRRPQKRRKTKRSRA